MKVLFLSKGDCPDYMRDMVYLGLMSTKGIQVEELNPCNYMHDTFAAQKGGLYGKGFTVFARLSSETQPQTVISVDEMLRKVADKYYDYIIYGSIHRYQEYLEHISLIYDLSKILIIDGEDHPSVDYKLARFGTYFKRELQDDSSYSTTRPISFAIPKELIISQVPTKVKYDAHIIAGDRNTYIFDKEEEYFADYQHSVFGHTKQKGGWDCCRHYEILMNGCIPYFESLEKCPFRTMMTFPKSTILRTNDIYKRGKKMESAEYEFWINSLLSYTRLHNTTEALISQLI